jgi:UDP-N-acetylglucosamine acyltransferase
MPRIHPTAIVAPGAQLDDTVEIGPYAVVGSQVTLGPGTRVMAHAFLDGHATLGAECVVFPFASIGTRTQDRKFKGGAPRVQIGDRTVIRESATVNCATGDGDCTVVGSDCLLMAYAHVAHDCRVGHNVILANCGTLAGHVVIEDNAILGGLSAIHQFVRIGQLSIIGGCSRVIQDVPPFMMAEGNPLAVRGLNSVGLKRQNVPEETQRKLKEAYKVLYMRDLSTRQALDQLEQELAADPHVRMLVDFIRHSERGIAK